MSWREFLLRSFAYKRSQLNEWRKVREIAYYAMVGSHVNPKRLPKSIQQFMPLDGDVVKEKRASEAQKEAFFKAVQKFNEQQSKLSDRGGNRQVTKRTK